VGRESERVALLRYTYSAGPLENHITDGQTCCPYLERTHAFFDALGPPRPGERGTEKATEWEKEWMRE